MYHDKRLSIVSDNLKNIMNNEVLIIKIKKFYKYTDFDNFIKNEYNINNNNDGIIFMPNNLSVMSGTQYSLFKWKPLNKHSFDFLIKEENKNLEAYVYHLKNITLFAKINEDWSENFIGYSAIAIIVSTCLGSFAVMTSMMNGSGIVRMISVFLVVAACSIHNASILTLQKPKTVLNLLIASLIISATIIAANLVVMM